MSEGCVDIFDAGKHHNWRIRETRSPVSPRIMYVLPAGISFAVVLGGGRVGARPRSSCLAVVDGTVMLRSSRAFLRLTVARGYMANVVSGI